MRGVTTAATLWFTTTMGLCFGGGQIGLGLAALALAIFVLWPLKWAERWVGHHRRGTLSVTTNTADLVEQLIMPQFTTAGFRVGELGVTIDQHGKARAMRCDIHWHEGHTSRSPVEIARELGLRPDIDGVEWQPLEHQ